MAAVTPQAALPGITWARDGGKLGRVRRFDFGATAGGSDTWTSGIKAITGIAWEGTLFTDHCAPTVDTATTIITLNAAGVITGGSLYIWSRS